MHEIGEILAATDLSAASDGVVRGAGELAHRAGARLRVLHAVGLPAVPVPVLPLGPGIEAPLYEEQRATAARRLDAQVERCVPRSVEVEAALVEAEAAPRAICRHAEEAGADLVVIGPHGDGKTSAGFLGTTADAVLRSAPVPVLVLRETVSTPSRRILVPVDPLEPSTGIIEAAFSWVDAFSRPVTGNPPVDVDVVHILLDFATGALPFRRATVEPGDNPELAAARVQAPGGVTVRERVLWGERVEEAILEYARERRPDLLVAGSHGRGAIKRALLGGTSSELARRAPCAVLLVPPALWAEGAAFGEHAGSRKARAG